MVRLPTLRVSPQVSGAPQYGAPRIVPQQDATGEQMQDVGRGLAAAGIGVSRMADFLQDQVDDAKSQREFTAYAEAVRKIERDYETQEGEGAVNGLSGALEALEKAREAFEGRLDNEKQHELFAGRADTHEFHVRDRIERHGAAQTRTYNIGAQATGAKDSNTEYLDLWRRGMPQDPDAAANWVEATKLARETGLRNINKLADLHGDSPEVRKVAVLAHTTDMHEGVVRLLAKDRADQAALYLQRYSSEIDPRRLDELQGLVKKADADEKALTLFAGIRDEAGKSGPLAEQERYAMEILEATRTGKKLSADVWRETERLIKSHFAQQHHLANVERAETLQQAESIFSKDKAATTDTLPEPMREQFGRLGIYGDVRQKEMEVRARELVASKRDPRTIQLEHDVATVGRLNQIIKEWENAEAPEDATPAQKAEFEQNRKKQLAFYQGMLVEIAAQPRDTYEMKSASKPTQTPAAPKKSQMEKLRDLANQIRGGR